MLMQSPAAMARKLLVDEKITACVKQMSPLGCCIFLVKHSAFLKKDLHSTFKFCASSKLLFFYAVDWPTTNFLEMYCFFFSCNPISYGSVI